MLDVNVKLILITCTKQDLNVRETNNKKTKSAKRIIQTNANNSFRLIAKGRLSVNAEQPSYKSF